MYVISRESPSAPDGRIYWTGGMTDVQSEGGEVVVSPSFSFFVDDAAAVKTEFEAKLLADLFNVFSPRPPRPFNLWVVK